MRFRLTLLLFSLSCITAFSQSGKLTFTNYSTAQGLPDNNIQALIQDSRGFLWIGSMEGLSRFDGKTFKNFYTSRNDTVLKANDFSHIFEYKKGHLVMNNYARVICFNTYTEKFYLPKLPINSTASIGKQPGQPGYTLTGMNRSYLLDEELNVTDSIVTVPAPGLFTHLGIIYLTGQQKLLVQYGRDFYLYDRQTRTYEKLSLSFYSSTSNSFAYFRYYDPDKQYIYFSDYFLGLFRYSLQTRATEKMGMAANGIPFINGFVYDIKKQKDGTLWLITENGINVVDEKSNTSILIQATPGKSTTLVSNNCYTICNDRENNTWIATSNGISKLSAGSRIIRSWSDEITTSLNAGLMSAVKGADGMIYASVYFDRSYQVNPTTGKVTALTHPLNNGNWNLFAKGDEVIRTGATNQLLSYNTRTGKFTVLDFLKPFYPDIELIVLGFIHSNGDEWYCANRGGGFVRKIAGTNTFKTYRKDDGTNHFSNGYYTSYTETPDGDLWFGVNKTSYLLHWNKEKDQFNEIDLTTVPGTINKVFTGINAITHDAEGNLWVAYNGSGVVKYNPRLHESVLYSINDGLPTNYISGLAFDNNNRLWLNTFKGLTCFMVKDKKFVVFRKEDGLPDDYFSDYCIYFDKEKNELWTGANSTLMAFNPDQLLSISKEVFPLYIDGILVNSNPIKDTLQKRLWLKPSENNLQFFFTGVDLSKGKDIEYSYKLDGADGDWIYSGNSQTASYSNLKFGNYTFRVRARHRGDNKWNEISEPVELTIATPWNKTWAFRATVVALISLLLWYIIRTYYRRRLEKQRNLLEKQQAIEKERTRIATDMHDDFGASLSRIKFLSEKLQLLTPADPAEKNDLEKISLYSDEMAEKMNEIVWALNQRYDSLGDLVSFCRSYASEYLQDKDIKLSFQAMEQGDEKIQGEVRRNIFLVIKEALRNIVKHAGATAVSIRFDRDDAQRQLIVTIADNGRGINLESIRPFANGLENMKKRMSDIGGQLSISGNNGTTIAMKVPC